MKKILAILIMVAACCDLTLAQTVSGSNVIGGGITYYSSKQKNYLDTDEISTSFSFIPSYGRFVIDNLAVGINAGIRTEKNESDFTGNSKSTAFLVGPFVRYYKHTNNENFAFFAQASLLFISGKEENEGTDVANEIKSGAFDISVSPGFAYFFNEHWSAELYFRGIAYTVTDPNKDDDDDEITEFEIGLNSLMPSLALRYYF